MSIEEGGARLDVLGALGGAQGREMRAEIEFGSCRLLECHRPRRRISRINRRRRLDYGGLRRAGEEVGGEKRSGGSEHAADTPRICDHCQRVLGCCNRGSRRGSVVWSVSNRLLDPTRLLSLSPRLAVLQDRVVPLGGVDERDGAWNRRGKRGNNREI